MAEPLLGPLPLQEPLASKQRLLLSKNFVYYNLLRLWEDVMRKFWRQTVRRAAQGECVQSLDLCDSRGKMYIMVHVFYCNKKVAQGHGYTTKMRAGSTLAAPPRQALHTAAAQSSSSAMHLPGLSTAPAWPHLSLRIKFYRQPAHLLSIACPQPTWLSRGGRTEKNRATKPEIPAGPPQERPAALPGPQSQPCLRARTLQSGGPLGRGPV